MINLHRIAASVREYHHHLLSGLDGRLTPGAVVNANLPFAERLMAACQKFSDPELPFDFQWLFLGHPEILLAAVASLSFGKGKRKLDSSSAKTEDRSVASWASKEELALLHAAAKAEGIKFVNVNPKSLTRVGIFHTCSAVGDWVGMPADSARCLRFGQLIGLPTEVMLAGTSWMAANRSVYQCVGQTLTPGGSPLTETQIEDRLDLNAATRRRFYGALDISITLEELPAYDQEEGAIHPGTLDEIADYYTQLAQVVYGAVGDLGLDQKKLVAAARPHADDRRLPSAIRFLHRTGMFSAETGEADLFILAKVAEHFSSFTREVFIYFFAQWFAQRQYLGNTLKAAVCSEQRFDGAFHKHALHMEERWPSRSHRPYTGNEPMGAGYFPQYALASLEALPYSPLSLSVVQSLNGGMSQPLPDLLRNLCLLSGEMSQEEIIAILKKTSIYSLNRMMADLTSFLLACNRRSSVALKDACKLAGLASGGLAEVFNNLGVEHYWHLDAALTPGKETQQMWMSWLNSVESTPGQPFYMPLHLWFALQDTWDDGAYEHFAKIVAIVRYFYQLVTQRNRVRTAARQTATNDSPGVVLQTTR